MRNGKRYEGAIGRLSAELRGQVKESDLRPLVSRIEQTRGAIEQASVEESREAGQSATGTVQVTLREGREPVLEFPLVKENGVWKIASPDPVRQLAGE